MLEHLLCQLHYQLKLEHIFQSIFYKRSVKKSSNILNLKKIGPEIAQKNSHMPCSQIRCSRTFYFPKKFNHFRIFSKTEFKY